MLSLWMQVVSRLREELGIIKTFGDTRSFSQLPSAIKN